MIDVYETFAGRPRRCETGASDQTPVWVDVLSPSESERETIAQEYAPHKVRCNSIAPGAIQTPINKEAWDTKSALDELNKLIPYKRIGQPSDIGAAAVWLSSDESDYINGTTLFVDGAMTCYPGFTTNG